jgi:hypothetical protein
MSAHPARRSSGKVMKGGSKVVLSIAAPRTAGIGAEQEAGIGSLRLPVLPRSRQCRTASMLPGLRCREVIHEVSE